MKRNILIGFIVAACLIAMVAIIVWDRLSIGQYKVTEMVQVTPFTNTLMSASFRHEMAHAAPNIRRVAVMASTFSQTSLAGTTTNQCVNILITCTGPSMDETRTAGLATAYAVAGNLRTNHQVQPDVFGPITPIQKRKWSDGILDWVHLLFNR